MRDRLGVSAPADIQEVGGHAAGILDDVHRGHGQARAIDHAPHVSVELDVVQTVFRSLHIERVFFSNVAELAKIGVTEQSVVIESDFGVEREESAVGGGDKGIDLKQGSVGVEKTLVEISQKLYCGIDLPRLQAEFEGYFACLKGFQAHAGIDMLLPYRIGIFFVDLLNFHASSGRGHENRLALGTIYQNAEIQFRFYWQRFFN